MQPEKKCSGKICAICGWPECALEKKCCGHIRVEWKKGGLKKSDASKCDLMKGRFYGVIWKRNPWDRDYEVPAGICFVIRNKGNIVFCAWIT